MREKFLRSNQGINVRSQDKTINLKGTELDQKEALTVCLS